jgi:hypothetical protein
VLTGLEPGQTYYYVFGGVPVGETEAVWSAVQTLKSHPGVGPTVMSSAILFGDMGVTIPYDYILPNGEYSQFPAAMNLQRIKDILASPDTASLASPRMLVHIGDISYARGYPFIWEWFFSQIAPVSSQVAYMVGIGNHEFDYKGSGEQWVPSWAPYGTDSGGECGWSFFLMYSR